MDNSAIINIDDITCNGKSQVNQFKARYTGDIQGINIVSILLFMYFRSIEILDPKFMKFFVTNLLWIFTINTNLTNVVTDSMLWCG